MKKQSKFGAIAALATLPFALAVPPIVGWFIGKWLDKKLETRPYLMYLMIFMGLLTGIFECYRLIKGVGDDR